MTDAVIVSTARTGLAKSWKGAFNMTYGPRWRPCDRTCRQARRHRPRRGRGRDPGRRDLEGTTGGNVARVAALRAGLPITVGGVSINRFCSSGLQTIALAAQRIIVDGAPVMIGRRRRKHLLRAERDQQAHARRPGCSEHKPEIYWSMLQTAEQVAKRYNMPKDAQDAYGVRSQQRAAAAQAAGKFKDEIVPDDHHDGRRQGHRPESRKEVTSPTATKASARHHAGRVSKIRSRPCPAA
jgi:acetyl-CoA C-acetyltransferase